VIFAAISKDQLSVASGQRPVKSKKVSREKKIEDGYRGLIDQTL